MFGFSAVRGRCRVLCLSEKSFVKRKAVDERKIMEVIKCLRRKRFVLVVGF